MVQVNVVVQDKKGNPVSGLTKDDFTLLDTDVPQKIAFFAQEGGPRPPSTPKPLVVRKNSIQQYKAQCDIVTLGRKTMNGIFGDHNFEPNPTGVGRVACMLTSSTFLANANKAEGYWCRSNSPEDYGGRGGTRTPSPLLAEQVLSKAAAMHLLAERLRSS